MIFSNKIFLYKKKYSKSRYVYSIFFIYICIFEFYYLYVCTFMAIGNTSLMLLSINKQTISLLSLYSLYTMQSVRINHLHMCSILTKGSTCRKNIKLRFLLILIEQVMTNLLKNFLAF